MFKSNQTRYRVFRVYLESRTKRIFAIACLGKKFVFQSEISSYSLILFLKNIEILSGQGVVQIKPNSLWSIPCVPRVYNKKNFCYSLPRKKVRISIGNIQLFAYSIFKNIEILSGQGVVQIKPNSV